MNDVLTGKIVNNYEKEDSQDLKIDQLKDRIEVLEKTVARLEKENIQLSKMLSAMNHYRVQDFS